MNKMAKVEDNRIKIPDIVIDKIIDYVRDLRDGPVYREQFKKVLRELPYHILWKGMNTRFSTRFVSLLRGSTPPWVREMEEYTTIRWHGA